MHYRHGCAQFTVSLSQEELEHLLTVDADILSIHDLLLENKIIKLPFIYLMISFQERN